MGYTIKAKITNWDELEALVDVCKEKNLPVVVNDELNPEVFAGFKFKYEFETVED